MKKALQGFLADQGITYVLKRNDILSEPTMMGFWTESEYAIYAESIDDRLGINLQNGHRDSAVGRLLDLNIRFDLDRYDEVRMFRQIDMVAAKLALNKVHGYPNTYTLDD